MKIVFASAEATPFASTGGLGEVSGALPRALTAAGDLVIPVMPMYRSVIEGGYPLKNTGIRLRIPLGFAAHTGEVWVDRSVKPEVYFIRRDEFFDRSGLYGNGERDYDDNLERFVFFQKAVVALIDELRLTADIVHSHDWTGGLLPLFLKHGIHGMGRNRREHSVFTIHNLAYQGSFSAARFPVMNLPFSCFSIETMEFFGKINCAKAGCTTADRVTTVSGGYASEILEPEHGCGLDGVLRALPAPGLGGILNGIDGSEWDPSTDPCLAERYDADHYQGKAANRDALLKDLKLDTDGSPVLIGMIGRLVDQKGLDILAEAMPDLMAKPRIRFVMLGSGEPRYEDLAREWMQSWPKRVHAHVGYDATLSHQVEAAADIHLMPSRFEPCGLGQFHALRYGTLPVVNPTGGLSEAIHDLSENGKTGNGIRLRKLDAPGLLEAIDRAIPWVSDAKRWPGVARRLMGEDHSWNRSAGRYREMYQDLLSGN